METLGIPMASSPSPNLRPLASQSSRRLAQRSWSGRQTPQQRFTVRALQRARSTSFPVVPSGSPNSPINEQDGFQGSSASHFERLPSERSSLSRLDVELMREVMTRRMVQTDKEPSEKDSEDKPNKTNDSNRQLWIDRARNLQINAQIFCSMMFWIVLFFISSIMDGENRGLREPRNRRGNRDRRK